MAARAALPSARRAKPHPGLHTLATANETDRKESKTRPLNARPNERSRRFIYGLQMPCASWPWSLGIASFPGSPFANPYQHHTVPPPPIPCPYRTAPIHVVPKPGESQHVCRPTDVVMLAVPVMLVAAGSYLTAGIGGIPEELSARRHDLKPSAGGTLQACATNA
ncbi:hypothetical protein AOQ84DRAFT_363753 [Glonium stellatum]|uniref:Uncharacterized protein n=1 Tax=Glonium stellatum TaxID=574774 RepID=A0A8E2F1Q5_9PEZI|nr:hypothetical protein AOQ84DRAFT_363753 [Glonium stellatum]